MEVSRDVRKDVWQAKAGPLDLAINAGRDRRKLAQSGGTQQDSLAAVAMGAG